jgi:hypothetical protein
MKNHLFLLICTLILFSCKKDIEQAPEKPPARTFKPVATDCSKEFGELFFRPAPALEAQAISTSSIRLKWKRQGRTEYIVKRDVDGDGIRDSIYACDQCNTYTETGLQSNTTYTYEVNGLVATATTFTEPVPPNGNNTVLADFDGHLVTGTSWNWNGDFYATPSGLNAEEVAISLAGLQSAFARFNLAVTTDEVMYNFSPLTRRQRLIVTENYIWFGAAGGVAFVGSWGGGVGQSEQPCFAFSSLLGYNTKNIIFAGAHELGHTLGLYHAVDFCGQSYSTGPWYMGGNYQQPSYGWQELGLNNLCETVCEPCVIEATLQ